MERALLQAFLEEGLSLEAIGQRVGKDASTVGYWCKRHGLQPIGHERYAPRGGLSRETLEPLLVEGLTLVQIAERLERSTSTVSYWLRRHGLRLARARGERTAAARRARAAGSDVILMKCAVHGETAFKVYGYGRSRCLRCRSEAVTRRRRKVKRILVEEAGGRCRLCGYDRCPEALEFHHLDRASKVFALSGAGVTRSLSKARLEAQKCMLLCANCHAEVEGGVTEVPLTR